MAAGHPSPHVYDALLAETIPLHPRILQGLERARIRSLRDVLYRAPPELLRTAALSEGDVAVLYSAVRGVVGIPVFTAFQLTQGNDSPPNQRGEDGEVPHTLRLATGCAVLDEALGGGILSRGITEIVGESGSGKTQFCLQLCLTVQLPQALGGLAGGAVYFSTEDVFPHKRLHQMIPHFTRTYASQLGDVDPGDNILVDHLSSLDEQWEAINVRLPALLSRTNVRLVVIDSIAALYRAHMAEEFVDGEAHLKSSSISRAKSLGTLGARLKAISDEYHVPIVCVNQVSDAFNKDGDNECERQGDAENDPRLGHTTAVIPALGLVWSAALNVRLMLRRWRLPPDPREAAHGMDGALRRTMSVVLAPHLANVSSDFEVVAGGVRGRRRLPTSEDACSM